MGQVPLTVEFTGSVWNNKFLGRCNQGNIVSALLVKFVQAGIISLDDDIAIGDKKGLIKLANRKRRLPAVPRGSYSSTK